MEKAIPVINAKRNRWMFSLGTSGRDMYYQLYSAQMLAFILFTKTLTDAQFTAISLILVFRMVFDAVIDPFIGRMVENTRSRWGRFKPWIVVGMITSAILTIAIFTLPFDNWQFIIMFGIISFTLSFTYSLNDIAYWGMLPTLTSDRDERAKLTSLAAFCGSVGAAAAMLTIPTLTNGNWAIGGSASVAFPVLAIICSIAMIGTQLITLLGAKEPRHTELAAEKAPKISIRDLIKIIVKNDQLLWASLPIFLQSVAGALGTSALVMFYVYLRFSYAGFLVPMSLVGFAIGGTIANVFLPQWHAKYGRKRSTTISLVCFAAGNLFILLTGLLIVPDTDFASYALFGTLAIGQIFTGFGSTCFYLTMLVSIANSVEYNEYKTGNRQEGLIFSVRPFVLQNSTAVTQGIITGIFILLGLNTLSNEISTLENSAEAEMAQLKAQNIAKEVIDKVAEVKNDSINSLLGTVDNEKIFMLLAAITVVPIVLLTIGWYVYRKKYFIDEEYYEKMRSETLARQEAVEQPES